MRNLHRGRAILVVVSTILCAVVVLGVHRVRSRASVSRLLEQARRAETDGDLKRARNRVELYLLKRPSDLDARELAVRIALDPRSLAEPDGPAGASRTIENLLMLDPDRHDLRLKLARMFLDVEAFSDAKANLDIVDRASPDNGLVEYYLGWIEERNVRFEAAVALYERARTHAPDLVEPYGRLARLYRTRLNNPAKADLLMDLPAPSNGLIQNNKDKAEAHLARATYRREFNVGDPAADIARALELDPKSLDVLMAAAREAALGRRYDESRRHIKAAEASHPGRSQVYLAGASIETRAGRFDDAVAFLRRGATALPGDLELSWNLADLLVQLGAVDEAEPEIDKLERAGVKRDLTNFLRAAILAARHRWSEAAPELELAAKALSPAPGLGTIARRAYLLMGRCYAELGNTDQQLVAYRRALSVNAASLEERLSVEARAGVAAALVDMGQIDEAIEEYRKCLLLPGAPEETKIILARLLIFNNLRMLESSRRWGEVEQLLDAAAERNPDRSDVAILRAESLAAQAKIDPARQLLEKARKDHPDRPDLWVALAMLAQRDEKPSEAMRILDDADKHFAAKKPEERVDLRIARARLIGRQGNPNSADLLRRLAENTEELPTLKRRDLVAGIAEAFVQIGDVPSALELWKKMGLEQPNDLVTRLVQFDMALQDGNKAEVDRVVEEIRRIEGDRGSLWRYGRGRLLIEEFKKTKDSAALMEARDLLGRVAQDRPAWSRAPLALGEIDDLRGTPNVAVRYYLRAVQLGDRSPLAVRRSIQILFQQRRYDAADQVLRKLQEQLPISGDLQRMAADISIQTRDYDRALSLARRAVLADSAVYGDHIWLGQLLWIVSQRTGDEGAKRNQAEADRELRKAVELGHDKPDAWVALIQFLAKVDRGAEGERLLKEAEAAIPPSEAPLALGQASEALGKLDRAEALYLKAIDLDPDDASAIQKLAGFYLKNDRFEDARPHLERLIRIRGRSPDEQRWARRILGLVQAGGNYKEVVKGLEILGLGDEIDEEQGGALQPIDDLRAKVRILMAHKTLARREEAKRVLDGIIRRETAAPDDLFLYGTLHESEGNWSKAREKYILALNQAPDDPSYVAEFARALIRHQEHRDAPRWLAQLERLRPAAPEVSEIKARILAAEGKNDEAAAVLLAYVQGKESRLRITAELLEELKLYEPAETLFRRLAGLPGEASRTLRLAEFLGRRQRTAEALDLCERAWTTCKPEDVSAACVQILYRSDGSSAFVDRVALQFERMVEANPNDVPLLFELANIRGLQGRISEAEKIYTDAYRRNPENGAPLNNLAWLQAFQPGRHKEALDNINQAINLHSALAPLLDTRAVVHLSAGTVDMAIKDLEEAVAVEPKPERFLHLARAYWMAQRRTDALAALKDAESLGLSAASLHPFDRKPYVTLVAELNRRP